MIKVIAQNFVQQDCLKEAAPLFREMIETTRKENGCIEYKLYTHLEDETRYVFVEEWVDQAALDAHMKSEHFTRIIPQLDRLKSKQGKIFIMSEFK